MITSYFKPKPKHEKTTIQVRSLLNLNLLIIAVQKISAFGCKRL